MATASRLATSRPSIDDAGPFDPPTDAERLWWLRESEGEDVVESSEGMLPSDAEYDRRYSLWLLASFGHPGDW